MKRNSILLIVLTTTSSFTSHLSAQSYGAEWSTIDGGGGNCVGAKFALSGTVGQPDTGDCMGGNYVCQGGFHPAFVKDTGPALHLAVSTGSLAFTWTSLCTGFVLEGAPNLNGPWTGLGSGSANGRDWQLTLPTSTPYRFFRLRKVCPQ